MLFGPVDQSRYTGVFEGEWPDRKLEKSKPYKFREQL